MLDKGAMMTEQKARKLFCPDFLLESVFGEDNVEFKIELPGGHKGVRVSFPDGSTMQGSSNYRIVNAMYDEIISLRAAVEDRNLRIQELLQAPSP
jgi:hypothetical protein